MDKVEYDPDAVRYYDFMRGGFVWGDELPVNSQHLEAALDYLIEAIVYRSSLSLGIPDTDYRSGWERVQAGFPGWPGFRSERIYGQVQRDLKAAKIWEDRCYTRLENEMAEEESGAGSQVVACSPEREDA